MSAWDILLNVLGWGAIIILGIVLAAVIVILLLIIVGGVNKALAKRSRVSLEELLAEALAYVNRRAKDEILFTPEQRQEFIKGATWAHGAHSRKRR